MKAKLFNKRIPILSIGIATLAFALFLPSLAQFTVAVQVQHSTNVVAVFNSRTLPSNAATIIEAAGGRVLTAIPEIGVVSAEPTAVSGDAFIANLRGHSAIHRAGYDIVAELPPIQVQPDDETSTENPPPGHPMPPPPGVIAGAPAADRYYIPAAGNVPANQWAIYRVGGFGGGIYGFTGGAWDVTTGSPAVTIAIIDTGISPLHPDVGPKVIDAQSAIFGVTPNLPFDDGTPDDQQGHGTWTSSLAAGSLDPVGGLGGVVGVAPGVSLANLKTLVRTSTGGGSGQFAWTVAAIVYAGNMGYDVISMSLGGFADLRDLGDVAIYTALLRATNHAFSRGSLLVASAGNSGLNLDGVGPFVHLPSGMPNVIAVSATDNPSFNTIGPGDHLAFYSNFGSRNHGLAAPGGDFPVGGAIGATGFVRGACTPGKAGPTQSVNSGCFSLGHVYYVRAIGTSASAPLVSGAAALVISANPGLRPNQVRAVLYQTAEDIGPNGYDLFFNFGMVRADLAVVLALTYAGGTGSPAKTT